MAPICPDFKWLSFRISDPIQNPDHLQPNLFLINLKSRLVRISDPHCSQSKSFTKNNPNFCFRVTGEQANQKVCSCQNPKSRQFYQFYADPNDICNCNFTAPVQQVSLPVVPAQADPVSQVSIPVFPGAPVVQTAPIQAPVGAFVPIQSAAHPTDFIATYYPIVPYQYQIPVQQQQLPYLGYPGLANYWPMAAHGWGYLGKKKRDVKSPTTPGK